MLPLDLQNYVQEIAAYLGVTLGQLALLAVFALVGLALMWRFRCWLFGHYWVETYRSNEIPPTIREECGACGFEAPGRYAENGPTPSGANARWFFPALAFIGVLVWLAAHQPGGV